jgi:hypothetical protein
MTTETWTVTQHGTGARWQVRLTFGPGMRELARMEHRKAGRAAWRTVTQAVTGTWEQAGGAA